MKTKALVLCIAMCGAFACEQGGGASSAGTPAPQEDTRVGNIPPLNPNNIVSLAQKSKDHTTLVKAIQAADYVTSVAASGPLTVFAPTNEAFDKVPKATLDELLKPENVEQLRNVLQYHVTTSGLKKESFTDGQQLAMANGAKTTLKVDGDKVTINGATIIASMPAENGVLHVIDQVLLPPKQ